MYIFFIIFIIYNNKNREGPNFEMKFYGLNLYRIYFRGWMFESYGLFKKLILKLISSKIYSIHLDMLKICLAMQPGI